MILACLFIPVMKSYLYDPVITEQTVCYVYPKWNDVQLDSALHSVIPDEKSSPKFKGKEVSYEKTVLEDGTIIFDITTSQIKQRCSFTEI